MVFEKIELRSIATLEVYSKNTLAVIIFLKIYPFINLFYPCYNRESRKLRFLSAPGPSVIASSFIDANVPREQCEVCLEGAVAVSKIAENIAEHGGCALIVDYGEEYSCRHSIRVSVLRHRFS